MNGIKGFLLKQENNVSQRRAELALLGQLYYFYLWGNFVFLSLAQIKILSSYRGKCNNFNISSLFLLQIFSHCTGHSLECKEARIQVPKIFCGGLVCIIIIITGGKTHDMLLATDVACASVCLRRCSPASLWFYNYLTSSLQVFVLEIYLVEIALWWNFFVI